MPIFSPGGHGPPAGAGIIVTFSRDEYPTWTATITGGDLPETGHVISSLSYARLGDEVRAWLRWQGDGAVTFTMDGSWPEAVEDDDEDDLAKAAAEYNGWAGVRVDYSYRFPPPVSDALERYWHARKQHTTDTQAVAEIFWRLLAHAEDVAAMLYMTPEAVRDSVQRDGFRRAGRPEEDWQYWQEHRAEWRDQFIREHGGQPGDDA
jgi:hypothetical protein